VTFDEAIDYLEDSSYDVERTIEAVAALREVQAGLTAAKPATECPACGWQNDQEAMDCEAAYEKATGRKLEPGDKEFLAFRAGWIAGHTRAAQPKAPSPAIEFEPVDRPGGFVESLKAPSPTPGEVEPSPARVGEALAYLNYYAFDSIPPSKTERMKTALETLEAATLRAALPAQGWSREPKEPGLYWCYDLDFKTQPELMHVVKDYGEAEDGTAGWYLAVADRYGEIEGPLDDYEGWWMPASVPTPPNAEPGERSGE
jgi:hypothetical protein